MMSKGFKVHNPSGAVISAFRGNKSYLAINKEV
jgi:hypothetical protein